jgi:hypothetical protein
MANGIHYGPDNLRPADEAELLQVIQQAVMGTGRRSVHLGDKVMAAHVATMVLRAVRESNHVILQAPPTNYSLGHLASPWSNGR